MAERSAWMDDVEAMMADPEFREAYEEALAEMRRLDAEDVE